MIDIPENNTDTQLQELADLAGEKGIEWKAIPLIDGRVIPLEYLNPNWEANFRSASMMLKRSAK